MVAMAAFLALALSGKPLRLPVFVVAEIEDRLNTALHGALPEAALALGAVDVTVDPDWVPRLRLEDVRLLKADGQALLTLPDLRLSFDPGALLHGRIRPTRLRLIGAHLEVTRDAAGQFDFALGQGRVGAQIRSFPDLFAALDRAFASPLASSLERIETEALTLTLDDYRAGRTWEVADGRLVLENRRGEIAAELALSLEGGGGRQAQALVTAVLPKGAEQLRITADFTGVAAHDVAAQAAPLAWAGVLDAPISGHIATTLARDGITALEADLGFGAGALQPSATARPIPFDKAGMALRYDPAAGRIELRDLVVESATLRVRAQGQSYLVRADGSPITGALAGELPDTYLAQLQFAEVKVDPEGLFQEPLSFDQGALDLRLRLNPFTLEIGQLALSEGERRLSAKGRIGADARGWTVAVDLAVNALPHDRLLAIWPLRLVPGTRAWVQKNVLAGTLRNVRAALRIAPEAEPVFHLGYDFARTDVRFVATLPPVRAGDGYASIDGKTYLMVMSQGTVTPPEGGEIDVAGSVFRIADVTRRPAIAEITLETASSLTAALSLLDQPPFHFLTRADQPVTLGQGRARIRTQLRLPLQKKIALADVSYQVAGQVSGFSSDTLVAGRRIEADLLDVAADKQGLLIAGAGRIGAVPFDVSYSQSFAADQKGKARIEGQVTLSQATVAEFGLGLPAGMVTGEGQGQVVIELQRGQPGRLVLVSDLNRIGLAIPELGWSKPPARRGRLDAEVVLDKPPRVQVLRLEAPGLAATGSVTLQPGGGLEVARFDSVKLGDWLDAAVAFRGRGAGRPVAIAVEGGTVDIRKMPGADRRAASGGGGGSGPLRLQLDRLRVSETIAFTGFQGDFTLNGGFAGDFVAAINGKAPVTGSVAPARHGSAVRLQSANAGAALKAAGVFSSARGGQLDLHLTPRATPGHYDGAVVIRDVRVVNTNILAEILNAMSIVGLLEQLNGSGLMFNEAEGEFVLTPDYVQVLRSSAVGASMGVSMAGSYAAATGRLNMEGVISPVYMLNGIGAIFSRRGEGVLGFNYGLAGTAEAPEVSVNPLSILTPGMFREIFRQAPPAIGAGNGDGGGG